MHIGLVGFMALSVGLGAYTWGERIGREHAPEVVAQARAEQRAQAARDAEIIAAIGNAPLTRNSLCQSFFDDASELLRAEWQEEALSDAEAEAAIDRPRY
ncbi:MAG: hypothetical protein RL268_1974 [Pseudomonadota bacterium]|jgi:hypothetical protein